MSYYVKVPQKCPNVPQIRGEYFFVCSLEFLAFRGVDAQSDGVPNRAEGRLCKRITAVIFLILDVIYYLIAEKMHCNHKKKFR